MKIFLVRKFFFWALTLSYNSFSITAHSGNVSTLYLHILASAAVPRILAGYILYKYHSCSYFLRQTPPTTTTKKERKMIRWEDSSERIQAIHRYFWLYAKPHSAFLRHDEPKSLCLHVLLAPGNFAGSFSIERTQRTRQQNGRKTTHIMHTTATKMKNDEWVR